MPAPVTLISPHQIIVLLRTVLSADDIRAMGGPVRERQGIILKNPGYKVNNLMALMKLLAEQKLLPFDEFWLHPIMEVYELAERSDIATMEKEWKALFETARVLIEVNPAMVSSNMHRGALLFAAKYLSSFSRAKQAVYAQMRPGALQKSSGYWELLLKEMQSEHGLFAVHIKGTAAANIVVNRWNATVPAERNTEEMKQFIHGSSYFKWAAQQMRAWPLVDRPAFNCMGIASRFLWRHCYPALLAALIKAKSEFWEEYPEYLQHESDYQDFDRWLDEQLLAGFKDLRAWLEEHRNGEKSCMDVDASMEWIESNGLDVDASIAWIKAKLAKRKT